jgi:hypothetical protein
MIIQNWLDILIGSLQSLWLGVVNFIPSLLGAIIVFILGLIIASGLDKLVERLIYWIKLDSLLRKAGLEAYFQRANLRLNSGYFLGKIVYWFIFIVFLVAAAEILGLPAFSQFLQGILSYVPTLIVAILILIATFILANFLQSLVSVSVFASKMHIAKPAAAVTWWVVIIFGFFAALLQLGVATQVINTLITGFIAMLVLAGGLAFGLGGKDLAAKLLEKAKTGIDERL